VANPPRAALLGRRSQLLDEIAMLAREKWLDSVCLDVIDTNPRAK
jgi:hypothetical protein